MTEANEVIAENNGQENNKNGDNAEGGTELESAIIRQVTYYFGDVNLTRDKFLREHVQLDDGWVPIEILIRFNRLAKLSTDTDVIANALKKATSGLLEISEDNKKVRRNPEKPVPEMNEERRKECTARTVYAKGFPKDSVIDDLLKYFAQYEEVENVIMRKYDDKATKKRLFKGSVFATFKTREQAEAFLNTKDLKYEDNDLIVLWQTDYVQQKQDEYANKKEQKEKKIKEKEKEIAEKEDFKLPTGTVLHFSEGTDTMKREDIKDALTALGADVAYIDYKVGDKEGWVRLAKENTAKDLAEKMTDGKVKITDADVVFKVLEEDAEKTYLDKTIDEMSKRRRKQKTFSKNKGRKGGNRHYSNKRKHDQHDDGPPKKVKADES